MTSDSPDLGKGLFGYRKSAVNHILADRDIMLRQAEGRVRAAESKVAELEAELMSMRDRNSRMDEQLDRLRAQLDVVVGATFGHEGHTAPPPVAERPAEPAMPLASEVTTPQPEAAEGHGFEEPHEAAPHQEPATAWEPQGGWTQPAPEETSSSDADSPYGQFKDYTEDQESEASFTGLDRPEHDEDAGGMPLVFENAGDDDVLDSAGMFDEADDRAEPHLTFEPHRAAESPHTAWEDIPPPAEPTSKVHDLFYTDHYDAPDGMQPAGAEAEDTSVPYGFSFPDQPYAEEAGEPAAAHADAPSNFFHLPEVSAHHVEAEDGSAVSSVEPSPLEAEPVHEPAQASYEPAQPTYEPVHPVHETAQPSYERAEPSVQSSAEEPVSPPAPAAPPAPPPVSPETTDLTNRFLTEELAGILSAAEESATRIVERARATTQHQISRSNHLWREVQAEVARFASWREQVDPVIRSVQSKVEGVREHIEDVPEKIRQALAPMADSISAIDADLAELAAACTPPLLLTPTGLNPETDPEEWTIGDDVPFRSENSGSGEPNADHGDTDHLAG